METHLCANLKINESEIYLGKENIKAWQLQKCIFNSNLVQKKLNENNISPKMAGSSVYVFYIKDVFWEHFFDTDCNQQNLMILQNFK